MDGITVLLNTQGVISQTLLFGYFQYFSILFMFLSLVFTFSPVYQWIRLTFRYNIVARILSENSLRKRGCKNSRRNTHSSRNICLVFKGTRFNRLY